MFLSRVVIRGLIVPLICSSASQQQSNSVGGDSGAMRSHSWCDRVVHEVDIMLDLKRGVGYRSDITVLIHRLTVMLSDVVLFVALVRFMSFWWGQSEMHGDETGSGNKRSTSSSSSSSSLSSRTVYLLILANLFMAPGLVIIDRKSRNDMVVMCQMAVS